MAIMDSRRLATALLIIALVLGCATSEIEAQLDTRVYEYQSHNRSERPCKTPHKPLNGGYNGKSDGVMYETGDTITYCCNRGYQLIGEAIRTCNETANGWQSQEPYCQPEYIGRGMRLLNGLEDQLKVIERRITTVENNTSEIGNKIGLIVNKVSAMDHNVTTTESQLSSAIDDVSSLESHDSETHNNSLRILACTNMTNVTDVDTVSKCLTMQLGVRNGHSVSVFKWRLANFVSIPTTRDLDHYHSEPFYHTVPGYKLSLVILNLYGYGLWMTLRVFSGKSDEQLRWPFSTRFDMTVLLNDGTEFLYKYFAGQHPTCQVDRPYLFTDFPCSTKSNGWDSVWSNKKPILKDGSLVVKLYMYN